MRRDWRVVAGSATLLAAVVFVAGVLDHLLGKHWGAFVFSLMWIAFGIWAYADSHSKRAREHTKRVLREKGYGFLIDKDEE